MCINVLLACMYIYYVCAVPVEVRGEHLIPGKYRHELPCECQELNMGSPSEQQVLPATKLSLQSMKTFEVAS